MFLIVVMFVISQVIGWEGTSQVDLLWNDL